MHPSIKLIRWYKKYGRELPWRITRDPYKVLVSEIMLQQTQVPRVLEFYDRWIRQFPNLETLAKASNADVIKAWAGLGYNRRALILRDAARHIVKHGVPKTAIEWQEIRGIGPYTAAAIAIFAQHEPIMPIDTNIRRVLGRLLLKKPFAELKDDHKIGRRSNDWLDVSEFWLVPQALFDLSTLVCKKDPLCRDCPLRKECSTAERFIERRVRIPKQSIKKAKERVRKGKKYPDRIYRGRILAFVRENPGVLVCMIGSQVDDAFSAKDERWIKAMLDRMTKDQLIETKHGKLYLKK